MSRRKRFTRNLGRTLKTPLPIRTTVEWVRFEHESEPFGVFSYLKQAREVLTAEVCLELDTLSDWFEDHLRAPNVKSVERFWFCLEAEEYIVRARRLMAILRMAGIPIVERRTSRVPGKVKHEDNNQVAVLTYRDAPQPRRSANPT